MPGPGGFVRRGEEAVMLCIRTARQHHGRVWGGGSSLALRGVTRSHEARHRGRKGELRLCSYPLAYSFGLGSRLTPSCHVSHPQGL